ncbi:LOW QUALITY PROTEIN: nebulin [Aquila chrysaetos chrysaetos]|uniref:LOW QUALITY PROTEIN: nebulin n=1 Tax=Aquila chrysaetos chrysaetos TaxID=223781 RepID=UPI001176F0AB|nr:LOW QUALITY PROTEIN: nebulin [Aquila chrysaetos chrysaetos]
MEEEEYEEVVEYYIEETIIEEGEPHEVITEVTETVSTDFTGPKTITYTVEREETAVGDAAPPVRKKTIRTKVDPSKFLTPYLQHSNKMKDLFSENKYKEKFRKEKGKPYASTIDTPEIRRIKKVQDQLSEVKYRMAGEAARTICHIDEKAKDIEHAKKVSQQVSKVLYKQNWEENKDKYLLPPDAPELVNAIKNTAMFSKKLYTEDWEGDKTLFYPYNDSPELRRVAQAQKSLSDIVYKKGHDERKSKYTSLPDPPDVEQAKKVTRQLSDIIYHKDYKDNIKGKWSQTPCYDVAVAKMNAENISMRKYQEDFENIKDQIYFMQTETPEYEANKRLSDNVSKIKYRADYEKNKAVADYNVLPATENPLLRQLKAAGNVLSDKLYKEAYEQSKGTSMNYCDTPKFQIDTVLKNFSDVKYKDAYQKNILGHYLGSFEDPHHTHCMKVEAMKSDKNYKADYEEEKTKCYFPQTITQEYEAIKKLDQCKDHTYKKHPDQTKFTQVTDSPVQKQAQINSKQLSDITYKSKGEEIIHKYHLPPDVPQFIQAKVNAYNISDNYYKTGLEELKSRGYDLKSDAIPIRAAKAARQAASDVNYKKAYELAKGKLVGFKSLQDDPKLVHYMKVAKMQSEREYKKDYEKTKTKYNIPLDMVNVVGAKKAQEIASNANYKNPLHHYTYLPDAMNVELTKNMMEIQSDNAYKADYNNWMKGIGWIPIGSLEVEKAKKAGDALNEKKYRQHPDTIKFTSVVDSPVMVQAKQNSVQLNDKLYRSSGEEVKHKYTLTPDVPQFIQARYNAANVSDAYYKQGYHDLIAKGNNVSLDAIPITRAKASRNIASDYKYKEAYEKAKGKQVGFRSLQDDPKLVHYMNVAKIQSEREYKKDYEKTKTNYHTPPDMYSIQAAKQSQDVASNAHYKNLIHHYTYLPDAMDVELAKNMMQIQSDNAYKQEYNSWFKGIGWSPLGSLDVETAKKAGDALNEKKYRQHPDTIKFTSIPDSIPMVLAQHNTKQLSDVTYKQEGEKMKHKYTLDPDVPQFIQARVNAFNLSDANYKADWKKTIAKGYDLKPDAIPIIAAKASRNIASDYKYKESYEKEKGKQVGYRSLQDDPKLVHYMNVAKMQSDREYKKDYEVTKTKYHTPLDMFSVMAAKQAQEAVTNTGYKQPIHNYTLLPDAVNLELSRNVMQLQSDNVYKADFNNWLRGVGWIPIQSLDVEKAKKATEILSEKKYRQHPDKLKYSITMDAMEQVLAKQNAKTMNKRLYTDKWNKEKTSIHVMPDTPEILQSRVNQVTMSNKLYKAAWEEDKKKGYDMQPDAIPIKAAKASRDIASDYKYKLAYEKEKGKHIGFRSLEDDPKLVHFMQVAKMQSDREYKKGYEKSKTNFHTPVDMVSVVAAKKAQEAATNANYKNLIHTYNVLPDAMSLELAKNMMQIQSDNQYRAEYDESMKGVGWMPLGSLEAEKNKKAMEIVSEKKYRQHPDKLKYSVPMDSMNMVLALNNAKIMDEHKYKQAWEEDKKKVHITPDIPQIALAKANAFNLSDKMYRLSFEESRKKGYDLRADAIPIKAAKASRDIASDYKYKLGYEQDKGKLVGFRSLQDDPKLVHYMQVAKMQSDREYKKAYEMSKTHYQTPSDTLSIVAAKEAQDRVTNTNYKRLIHQYMLLPDAMSLELYRNMNQIQSDNEYKQDYNEWFKGIGWSPAGSLDVEKSKKATEIASDRKYRQHPSMFPFTKQNDAMDMVLAKQNANMMNKHAYTQAWEKDKIQVHVMPDTPDILQAKQNKANYSQKLYKLGWQEMIKKGYDLTPEAISVKAAKASRDIASDYKYKEGYRKQQGHHIGFRSLQDDPKMLWSMQVAKMQSEREYKKDFEKWKTKFNMPVDMLGFLLAKKCQELVSDIDYKHVLHRWTCLPDQIDVTQAKTVYELQSDNVYKSDLQWLRGLGWSPLGSLESEKNKKASEILSEKKYRQHPDTIKFTSIPDAMDITLAKSNAKNRSDILYREAWDKDKTQVHIMPDTPEILLAKSNLLNTSDKHYKLGYEELKRKGYDLPPDAIPIKSAKASRDIASEYQYKTGYRKQLGHHIGARNVEDDPKMMWSMHVAKIQSDREYKKAFEKTKTHFSSPVDMLGIVLAKKCQELVSDIDYKHLLHRWTCLPDQNDVVQARKVYDLQSDNVYKSDLLWLRGIGWSPSGSLDDEKNKRASLILSDKKYRQHPDTIKFTSIPDSMPMVLAKHNSEIMNQRAYTSAWEKDKTSVHIMPDTPGILLAQQNKVNFSEKLYKLAMEEEKKKGYDMRADAIPIKSAKASRDIASDYKYKEGYRKQLGHHIGARNIEDDPKMMWSMHVAKIQSDREYKKAFEKTKTHFSSPVDMLGIVLAKKCQELVSDIDYKHLLHRWTCLPDQNDVVQARKVYDLQSDNVYKSDLLWLRGIGWSPSGSLDDEKNKRASLILSDKKYRQHPDTIKFTSIPDSMPMVLAKHNSEIMNQRAYTSAWEKDKTSVHIMPDTPGILLAQQNKVNFSEKLYKLAMEEEKKKGYDMRADAIPIKSAKASRDIASDYKYKEGYRKQLGHHIGARNIEDDPKMMWSMHVAKIQSDREYKKAFEKTKTHFSSPVDMLGIVLAKKCQELVSDIDYKHLLHRWTCLPDQNDVVQARKVYDLQSDNVYKSDLLWLRGIGWSPSGSLDDEKNKRASLILSDKKYRQHPDTIKFTSIPDSMPMVLAKHNSEIMNQRAYTSAWEKDKTSVHIMPDTPGILLAQQNKVNFSEKLYKLAMEEEKKKGYDMRADAIPIKSAKASRDIASDYKYKEGYRKQLGHHIGARNIEDDPKMMWSMHVAKIQSDREYKKAFEKTKTHFSSPVDMLGIVLAKKCQELVSDIDYKHLLHRWTCLPDQNDVVQARKVYDLQSDNVYKSDLLWLRGIGWSPSGSLDDEKNKRASLILSDKKYRQHPDTIKFTSIPDSMPMVLAKHNSEIMNQRAYTSAWEKDKTSVHIMPDTPGILLAQQNKVNFSEKLYKLAMEEEKKKGYDMRADAIPIKSAKASRDIASDYKYKEGYRKQLGHHIGARNIEDDPKMMWSMHVAKIQSDREYKKAFEKTKTHFSSPVDMLGIVLAKKCQELVSDVDYRHYLHQWICLPDQNDVIHAKKAYDLQSDNCYKSDLEWLRGIGWVPLGSLEVEKAKKAGEILSDKLYRQPPDTIKFTSVTDSLEMVLAKQNAETMNKRLYTEAWDKDKTQIHIMPDTPEITLAKQNMQNYSVKLYKEAMEEAKKKGYDLRSDAIPIQAAKASREIASDYKYKEGYRKQLGHHIGARNIEDDPKMMWSMHVAKIQSDREYKKAFEKTKTHFSSPVDMLGIVLAKKCQELVSDVDYRHYLHQWICLPDQNDVIHAKKAYDLQSDNCYKSDLEWLRGIGWVPLGSLEVEKAKKAGEILSDKLYRQPPDTIKFTSVTDSLEMVLAKQNAETMNKHLYTEAWNKDKTMVHVMPDTPEILLAKQNQLNYSQKMYKLALEESKKKGHDLRFDAIPIQAAKASREIASDYKYKEGYRKQLGHHIGARNIEDDPKMMWSMHVAKIQSDREYKKAFEKTKTHFSSPVDMLGIVLAKKCQELVSDVDYRHYLHQWICLPDQNDVIHAKKAYDLQSDAVYKSDLEWLRGIGWVPIGSMEVEKAKKAGEILSERKYRQPADQIKFTSVTDSLAMVLAKQNAEIMNKRLYTEAWDADKTSIHVMPDTPDILLAKANAANVSHKLYIQAWEEAKKKGYDMRADAIPIRSAKASRDIASDYKYKETHEKQKGHYIGCRTAQEDPKLSWAARAMLLQNDRIYRKAYHDSKAQIHIPVDAMSVQAAKECQNLVSDVDYRQYFHQWTCLPDQNDVIHARKAYDLQSDNVYKSDLEWLRGIGWLTEGSVDVVKAKKAQELLNERLYRTRPEELKFTSVTDSPDVVQAKINALQISDHLYREAWDRDKTQITIPSDTPVMLQSKVNALNISNKHYQKAWDEAKAKSYDLRADAIPIKQAKASRDIASEYKYKETHEKQKGHYIGCRTAQEDPKLSWAARAMLLQNDRIYRKAYHDSKAQIHIPVDAMSVQAAKECQNLVSDVDYRQYFHQWTCLPDQNDVIHARKAYDLQSDNVYKSDLEWLRGIGWLTEGSVDVVKAKKAQELLNERLYRTRPEELKFTSVTDSPDVVQAKINALQISDHLYREAWDRDKTQITIPSDTPVMLQSKVNALNISNKHYQKAWDEAKAKSYDLRADAIPIKQAKASRDIASEYKYKETHEKQKGHYIGCRTAQEDPKLSWAARAMLLQNDRIYRKAYHDSKAQIHIPVDAMSVQAAKECQNLVSDVDYRQYFHQWTCLPDQNDVIHARKAYDLQSDNVYKSDLEWLRGIGWLTEGSVDVVKAKKAQELLNERLYRTRPEELKFTSVTDSPDVVQAKINALQISDHLYREAWDRDKTQITIPSDTPVMLQSKVNALNISNKHYQKAWDEAKAKSYDLRADAIPIKQAKASRDIASEYKYKETHEKQKGHYIGCRTAQEDPKLSWAARAMLLQNDRIYRKAYHDSKAQIHIPVDAMSVQAAKECQNLVSDVDYRQYFHQWTCLPDQNDVIHARKAYDLQSDAVYKSDLEWLRGIGWLPNDSPDVKRAKHAQDLLSDNVYRTRIESLKYTSVVDSPDVVLAKVNAEQVSIPKYKEAWEKDKTMIHIVPDTPEINLAKTNAVNYSQKLYKEAWDELKMSCDLRADAIPIKAAKASREIASDYKYKLDHEKQKGHYVGVPNAKADKKMKFALGIGKVQSELEYKKHFAKWKTQCHLPVDMLSIIAAKHGQSLVSDVDYRHYLHQWVCLPDQNDVIQARKAYDLQSDAIYKSDLEWLRGIGWLPNDSVGINHVKYAGDLLNERKYRTKVETLPFTPVADRVDYITAKNSGEIRSDIKYHKAWNEVKSNYTLTDTPQLDMAREAARILNQNLYKESWEKEKATGYLLPPDTVQICHAKRSNDVQSELKYKADYVKQRGHYVGVPSMRDDPKLVWFEHAGEIQNDRLYKSDYHKTKSRVHIPPDMVSVVAAKECQTLVSDIDYRQYLHEWTCHPDQNDCIQARKAYDLQSDNLYKSDLEWLRGCGWIPLDSVEHKKVKNAQELINKRAYTKEALDNFSNYTSVVDTPDIVLAKINSVNQSDLKYKETFNLEKGQYIGSDDTPALNHAKDMSLLYSDKLYKKAWEISKPIGYTLDEKYIPVVGAKRANYINSELKYKEIYEKLKGHYLAGKEIGDFPSVIHSLAFQKMRSALAYRKNYEDTKANVHIPSDMMNHVLAKKCQYILSDLEYRTYFHQWNCSPEENDVVQARKAQEILSDVVYKDDLNWLKGLGCYVWDTPQILHAKKSYDLQSQIKYTAAGKENLQNFGVVTDTPLYVTAVQSGVNASDVKYKQDYHKTKDKYTTVTETVDSERVQNLKHLFSNNLYKKAWEKVKATGYIMPSDAVSLARAKELKHNASIVKYREEYDKFKALYTLPRGVEDDPNTARCLRVGKLNIDRLYKEVYEKNKAKIHIIPDMVDIISAKDAQKKVSEIDYRTHLHEWICLPDLQINAHVRKVTDQVSDVLYKDDLNWLKGIGCFVWDTPEILHAKHAYDLRSDIKYKSKAEKMKSDYTVVMETPVYVQNVLSGLNLSEAVYRGAYMHNVKGKMIPTDKTVDLERAYRANKIQSENLYRWAGVNALPTGYTLPTDTPSFQHAKHVQYIGSDLKYKEAYEHMKAKGYTLGPKDVGFENVKKVNQVINERLYRATYHKYKDKIHTTPDTPEIRQVRATQEAVSDLIYKSDFFRMQGHLISLPYTPQVLHCRYVGDITSDNKYKEDLKWLKGLGCFLYDTPDMVRARHLRKLWSNYIYTDTAKKMWAKYNVVLDTPGYRAVQELKTHLSELVYRAAGKELKTKYTSILDTPDFLRAKQGQKIQSQYLYVELATKERPHHHAGGQTPAFTHARHVKDMVSEKKYKTQYEKMKDKYTPVPDTPILIRAKRAYLNASDLRYKETFENTKGKYHTVKDALDIVYHRKVTDDISSVKYKENYMSQLGIWRSIPDRPEHFHHRAVTDAISDVKYKEDLSCLRGIGCYAWDTPSFALAEKNKVLYSGCKYKEIFEKTKSQFQYVADSPINKHFKHATQLMDGKLYKAAYEKLKDRYSVIVDDPRNLLAKWGTTLSSQVEYKKDYEKKKDKYTMVVDTPEHLRTTKVNKQISDIIYKLEYNKEKPKGYTTIHDTPMLLHVRKVKDRISDLKYKEVYERNKSHCNVIADSVHIKTPRHAYKLNSNLDYKKKYEAAKAHWHWIADRPDFVQAAKSSLQQSDYEYKLDREFLKGCKLSVTDDKNTVLALNNAILASDIKYKEKHNKARGTYLVVPDTPQILLAKNVSSLVSENKYKEQSKKQLPHGSYTTLPETRDTVHVKEVTKNVSETNYKEKFVKDKGKSNYSVMLEPPEVKHAMEVAKKQSTIEYKKDAKSKLHYTPIADRPDIKKATQAAKLISNIEYKKRGEAGIGVTMLGRPDIELAKEVSKLTSQVKYKENFSKEMGKKPKYDLKEAKIYKTMKDAHNMASEVKYKADLKKLHKPVTDMSESLIMNHVLSTSQLASAYQYKKQYEKSKGHYHVVPDNLEQVHLREASELQSHVKYREKYEKEKGKPMLDFETPTYLTAKESQLMQSEKEYKKDFEESIKGRNLTGLEITPSLLHVKYATKIASEKEYRKDLEEGVKGKGLTALEETPDMLRAKNATQILNEKEYKKALELEIRGKGLTELALETPDFVRAKNATDIASQIKYKQLAEMEKANYTSVVDTPEIIHAQQVKNLSSQKRYKEDAERTMPYYVPVADTPEMQRVRENQKNFSTLQYQWDLQNSKGKVTVVQDTPEMLRVKENQKNFSSILYKEDIGTGTTIEKTPEMQRVKQTQDAISSIKYKESIGKGTPIPDLPEVKRVKETQKHISSVLYKEDLGTGIPTPVTPEIERVKRNQEHISSVLYKEGLGTGIPTPVTPEMERVKRNQENISSVLYKEGLGIGTPVPVTPEMERVKRNQENFSSVLYKEDLGTGTPTPVTPEIERVKRNQENFSSVLYKEDLGTGTPTPVTPEIERVKRNQENFSSVLYKEDLGTGTPIPVTPEVERVKRNQEHISSVLYKESVGTGTPTPITPEMERVKRNQEICSSVLYKENIGKATPTPVTPEMERVKRNQEIISSVLYKENVGKVTPTPITPEMERVKRNQEIISSVLYKENLGRATPTPITPEMERVKRNQEHISSVVYKEGLGKATPTPVTPEMERVKRNQEHISSVVYKEGLGKATPTPVTPEMERVKRNQEHISSVLYKEHLAKGTPTPMTPEMERAKRNQENISSVLYSDSFRKQVQGKAAYVLDTPEMRRVRETQKHISTVKYHEDFEKSKGSFTPVVTDPITERVKKNMQDFSDISYRGIQRRVVEMERKRVDQDQENLTGLRVWRTNPGSVFDYDPAEDNIQSRSLHMISVQAQRRSREHSRSASALSLSGGDEKSEPSDGADQHLSYYSNGGFFATTTTVGYKHAKTVELPQQRSSSVATQQTTVSSVPSHPSTAGKTYRAMYDYMAADADEVSFKDGDTIVNVQAIDEGWMYGTVQRTGKTGMLPANYVEAV